MARPTKSTKKKGWEYQVGVRPNVVTAYERVDKKGVVTLRWWPPKAKKYKTKSLGIYLRDAQGNIIPDRKADAEQKTKDAYNNLLAGLAPGAPAPGSAPANTKLTLTLEEGFALAFAKNTGMFDDTAALHYKEMERYKKRVLAILPGRTWESIVPGDYVTLWRTLANTYMLGGKGRGGRTATLNCVIVLAQTARWLSGARLINRGAAEPDPKWKDAFEKAWATLTGQHHKTKKLRHTPAELGRLHQARREGKGDPRLNLLFSLAAEARLGQAVRAMRSWLTLDAVGARELGLLHIPDYGKKKGKVVDLTSESRAEVDAALTTGYLRELEAEYQRTNAKANYPLFPGNRLVAGVAVAGTKKSLGKRALINLWHEFETEAGVAVVAGRGWYGVRRKSIDLAQDVEKDPRVLNMMSGHRSSETRVGYQDDRRPEDVEKATVAIESARELALAAAQAAGGQAAPSAPAAPSQWAANQAAKNDRRAAKHAADAVKKAQEEMLKRIAAGLPVAV
jgi:hypothetical protein